MTLLLVTLSLLGLKNIPAHASDAIDAPPFNSPETHFTDITPFYKWTGVLRRMDARPQPPRQWLDNQKLMASLSPAQMIQKVDDIINSYDYVAEKVNWGGVHWETPAEFFAHGGDCKDFAIAKYAWLRYLGIAEERLRFTVVYDRIQNMPHAVLIVYIHGRAMVLDNQVSDIRDSGNEPRYRLIYSINRLGWWQPGAKVSMMQFPKECLAGSLLPPCINAIEPAFR